MLKFLPQLLSLLQNALKMSDSKHSEENAAPDESPSPLENHNSSALTPTPETSEDRPAKPEDFSFRELGRNIAAYVRRRYEVLWAYRWLVLVVVVVGLLIAAGEQVVFPWLSSQLGAFGTWLATMWATRPVTLVVMVLASMFLLFDHRRLFRVWRWALTSWKFLLVAVIGLLILVLYASPVADRWVFVPAEVSVNGVEGQQVAIQFRGSLNSIGIKPFEEIDLTAMEPKFIDNALKTQTEIKLTDCPTILAVPRSFRVLDTIPFTKSKIGVNLDAGQQLSVSTVVGNVNLPLENLVRFFLVTFTRGFREFRTQVIPTTGSNDIQVVVNDDRGEKWTVEGPRQDLPQLINFLAHRIKIDDIKGADDQPKFQVENVDLAIALGNRAFDTRDFESALAYYGLAEWFDSKHVNSQVMLGLTHYQLSLQTSGDTAQSWRSSARRPFEQAIALAADGTDTNKNIGLYPYPACLHAELGDDILAAGQLAVFNTFIQTQRLLEPSSEEATQLRLAALGDQPPLGPGRFLTLFKRPQENTFDLYFISGQAINYVRTDSITQPALMIQATSIPADDLRGGEPLQIFAVDKGAYYLTRDGRVKFFEPPTSVANVIDYNELREPPFAGGIRQLFAEDTQQGQHLFLVNQLGQIIRMPSGHPPRAGSDDTAVVTSSISDTRQIYLDGNNLFGLSNDGAVWQVKNPFAGDLQERALLVADIGNQEIAANAGVIYMRRANGSVWRHLIDPGSGGAAADLQIVSQGATDLARMLIEPGQGLFLLNRSGEVLLIRNPSAPSQADLLSLGLALTNRRNIGVFGSSLVALEESEPERRAPSLYAIPEPVSTEPTPVPTPTQTPTSVPSPSPPTETPAPTPTATSTMTATPTDTAEAAATEAAPATAQATAAAVLASCVDGPQGEFSEVWDRHQSRLGCPSQPEPIIFGQFALQEFDQGFMFWSDRLDRVISVIEGDEPSWSVNGWSQFVGGGSSCANSFEPEPGQVLPINAFGAVWCENPTIRRAIGFGTDAERGLGGGIQPFEGGFILRDDDQSMVYVLFSDDQSYVRETNP